MPALQTCLARGRGKFERGFRETDMKPKFTKTTFSVIVDLLAEGGSPFYGYSSPDAASQIHNRFGGQILYESTRDGAGGGYVPDTMSLRLCNPYKIIGPNCRFGDISSHEATVGDKYVFVPIKPSDRAIASEWPVVVASSPRVEWAGGLVSVTELTLLTQSSALAFLRGEYVDLEDATITFDYIPRPGAPKEQFIILTHVERQFLNKRLIRRVVEGFYFADVLGFDWGSQDYRGDQRFYNRLGLWLGADNRFYRISNGICRDAFDEFPRNIQSVAPPNVRFFNPRFYIQEQSEGQFYAVGLFYVGHPAPIHVVFPLTSEEAVRAIGGNFQDLYTRGQAIALSLEVDPAASNRQVVSGLTVCP